MIKKNKFDKDDSLALKGFAIIFMLLHHLWWLSDINIYDEPTSLITIGGCNITSIIGRFFKCCVPLFLFLGGYGLYKLSEKKGFKICDRVKKLYLNYWKVFVIFVPVSFILYKFNLVNIGAYRFDVFSDHPIRNIFFSFLGLSNDFNSSYWFFLSYLICLLLFNPCKKIIDKFSFKYNYFLIIVFSILFNTVFNVLYRFLDYHFLLLILYSSNYIFTFFIGMLFAKDDNLIKIDNKLKEMKLIGSIQNIVVLILFIVYRFFSYKYGSYLMLLQFGFLDYYFIFYLVLILKYYIDKYSILKNSLINIGKYSTNMWLIHTYYIFYFIPCCYIVFLPKYALLCGIVLLAMTLLSSYIIDGFWNTLSTLKNKFLQIKKD